MRRTWLALVVVLSLIVFATPAQAGFTHNERQSEVIAEAGWSSGDWGDEVLMSGYASFRRSQGSSYAEMYFSEAIGTQVMCDNGTPDDPSDDWLGYEWMDLSGWGPATLSVAKSFGTATAEGSAEVWSGFWSDCWYYGEGAEPENGLPPGDPSFVAVTLALTADGPRVTQTGSYSFHIPGSYNEHSRNRSVFRSATGVVTVDGADRGVEWGQIGEYSWSSHANGK